MFDTSLTGLDRNRLRAWLAVFFITLALPAGVLVYQAYSQLKWEAFHQYRVLAEELAARIDDRIVQLVDAEEARSFADYAFLNVAGDPAASFLQRSPLSAYPPAASVPGLIGYFQVDSRGRFSTPLLPAAETVLPNYGISAVELEQRLALQRKLEQILDRNRLVQGTTPGRAASDKAGADESHATASRRDAPARRAAAAPTDDAATQQGTRDDRAAPHTTAPAEQAVTGQAAFDRLNRAEASRELEMAQQSGAALGRVEDLQLDYRYQSESAAELRRQDAGGISALAKRARRERSALPEPAAVSAATDSPSTPAAGTAAQSPLESEIRIHTFESEIDPFEFSLLDSGHFVLFRKVWRDGQRYIQGALIEQQPFIAGLIKSMFLGTGLSGMSDLVVAYRGDVLSAFTGQAAQDDLAAAEALRGTLLYRTRLSAPLGDMELVLSINRLPPGAGARVITWLAVILLLVLCGGFYLMYRLGAGQIDLARQQQDFVSAVSHELKTPLTSIRMYGEILRAGWASEEKKRLYYDYIFDESERLSRLIANVLQLARLNRNRLQAETKSLAVAGLLDNIRSRVAAQVERAGFELTLSCDPETGQAAITVDPDWFVQIFINLVDNAIKFACGAERKAIDVGCQQLRDGSVQFSVRDYGPGVPGDQMKKIFRLFYRSENELTRETVGTGIGLALVHQLARAMGGQVDVVNRKPGAEFRVRFNSA